MIEFVILALAFGLVAYAFYAWVTKNNDYFEKRNMAYLKPTFLLGTTGGMLMNQHHMDDWMRDIYTANPKEKIVGMFDFRQPMYLLRDPELIKQMTVKDFDYFEDHKLFVDATVDKLFGSSMLMMRGERWRDMRASLSPFFTGSKMRLMFGMVGDCAASMVQELRNQTADTGSMRTDVKDLFGRYATDVIATTAFGVRVNSIADDQNEFYVMGKRAMNFATFKTAARLMFIKMVPGLMRWLDIQLIDSVVSRFFTSMALDTIRTRLERNIVRPDLINLLMQLKTNRGSNGGDQHDQAVDDVANDDSAGFATVEESHIGKKRVEREWTDLELAAQCFLFFGGGFDTTSTTLAFLMYELALNADVQQRLYDECCAVRAQLKDGQLTYDTLQRMKYMDQVVSECLRLWPPPLLTDRLCVRDYHYDDGELRFQVLKGQSVWIPIFALHRDEQYFPEPQRFRPERFSDEGKDSIVPGTFVPFGVGPRNCIGSRFALMEVKAIVYHILLHFSVEPSAETPIPIRLAKAPGSMKTTKPIILTLKQRSN